ncbi:MAG: PEGA domain-containing protein [candidate division Zixibacteria bacterium]|nr:PEGA domain-containing protein [candidate division Zixibacteria bacterium]
MVKKSRVFWIFLMVLAVFLLSTCSKKKSTKPEPPKYKWTILGYFDGNNEQDLDILTNGSYVIQDVQEMEKVGSTDDVQIIVMLGSVKTEGNCNYYLIEEHLNELPDSISSEILVDLDSMDMSDYQTLRDFIKYGVENYPAEHYMLIINDHGSGWKGICLDQQNGGGEMMSLPGLDSALYGYEFEIIVFNAPSMSMLEVAYQLKDKANYLVASQFHLSMQNILGSSEWLQGLADDPDMSPGSLARNIVDEIYDAAESEDKETHIAAINLSKIEALASKVADLGNTLVMKAGAYWNEVFDAWMDARCYSYYDDSAFVDLEDFAEKIHASPNLDTAITNTARAVKNATGYAVIRSKSIPDYGRGGLSIHFPWKVSLFDSTHYVELDFKNSNWHVFLSHFIPSISGCLGGLEIISIPDEAEIFLNGQDTGLQTNTTIHGLLPGDYFVKLVKPGYQEKEWFATVESDTIITYIIPLYGGHGSSSPPQQADRNLIFQQ